MPKVNYYLGKFPGGAGGAKEANTSWNWTYKGL